MDEIKEKPGQCTVATSRKKERQIVSWTQEEDDTLRQKISLHGTENWAIIASNFKGRTSRQCRRRWCTYLNSDFKKGGWSPEEDMLLCEAQSIFGNRWTEIAKVVSGRTDNAVKNRFSTLCKKRMKAEASKNTPSAADSLRNDDTPESLSLPLAKKSRRLNHPQPFGHGGEALGTQDDGDLGMDCIVDAVKSEEVANLFQHEEKMGQELENECKIEEEMRPDMNSLMENKNTCQSSWRHTHFQIGDDDSPLTCEYVSDEKAEVSKEVLVGDKVDPLLEFGSPPLVTPLFRPLGAGIPSPKFTESERSFLLKTLGLESPASNQCVNSSMPPSCKRALLQS